jgi:hypothetical protein
MTEPTPNTSNTDKAINEDINRPITVGASTAIAQHIQELEAYLDNLLVALQRGEFPVNLQRVTQVFDRILTTDLPRLNLTPEKLVATYNDVPNLLAAYSIEANITSTSFQNASRDSVIFGRELNGNYWILPMTEPSGCAWLLLNPQRKILFDRLQSLPLAFDFDKSTENLLIKKPALVKLLPTEPPTWQVLQRGQLDNSGQVDGGNQALQAEITRLNKELRSLDERNNLLNQRVDQLTKGLQKSNDSVNLRLEKFKAALIELIGSKK